MRIQHLSAALLCLPLLVSAQPITELAEKDLTIDMREEEPAMRSAMEKARATLDDFLVKAKQPAAGTNSYAVKVAVREGPNTEYFWVNEFTWSDSSFTGRVNSEPRVVKGLKLGQIYKFSRSQIVDWTYIDEKTGRTFGNFTACAILTKVPPAQAGEFKRRYGLDCS